MPSWTPANHQHQEALHHLKKMPSWTPANHHHHQTHHKHITNTSQPPSSPNTSQTHHKHITNTSPNTAQLSPKTANTENIVTYTQEDFNKNHTCETCGIHYDKSKNLKRHNKKHHPDTITLQQVDGNTTLPEETQVGTPLTQEDLEMLLQELIKMNKSFTEAHPLSFTTSETSTQESNPNTTLTTPKLMTKKQQRMAERH